MTAAAGFAEVRFKGTRKDYFTFHGLNLLPGCHVIVEADRGEDLGEVTALGAIAERKPAPMNSQPGAGSGRTRPGSAPRPGRPWRGTGS